MRTCCGGRFGVEVSWLAGRRRVNVNLGPGSGGNGELVGGLMAKECWLRNGRPISDQISAGSERQRVVQPKGLVIDVWC